MKFELFRRLGFRPLCYVMVLNLAVFCAGVYMGLQLEPQPTHNNVPSTTELIAHNLLVGILITLVGLATFSIASLVVIGASALFNGIVCGASVNTRGLGWTVLHLSHAPLEFVALSAFFLAGSLTMRFVLDRHFVLREHAALAAQLLALGVVLMAIAGLLETFWEPPA